MRSEANQRDDEDDDEDDDDDDDVHDDSKGIIRQRGRILCTIRE